MHRFSLQHDRAVTAQWLQLFPLKSMILKGMYIYPEGVAQAAGMRLNRVDAGFPILLTKLSTALE